MSLRSSVRTNNVVAVALFVAATTMSVPAASAAALTFKTPMTKASTAAVPAGSVMLGGLSSGGWPAVMEISSDRKAIRIAVMGLDMTCSSGDSLGVDDAFVTIPVGAGGKVRVVRTIPKQTDPSVSITGSHSLYGKLDRHHLTFSGTWRLHLDLQLPGNQADHCDSGRVPFATRL